VIEHIPVRVDHHFRAGQLGNDTNECADSRQRHHTGSHALGVHTDDEARRVARTGPRYPDEIYDVSVRDHDGVPSPPPRYVFRSSRRECDQGIDPLHHHVTMRVVSR
jgi:hypothetical protein